MRKIVLLSIVYGREGKEIEISNTIGKSGFLFSHNTSKNLYKIFYLY